jgi:transposase
MPLYRIEKGFSYDGAEISRQTMANWVIKCSETYLEPIAVKPFVMGRKAWLFSNTPAGAVASSVMYSLVETAKENGLHPFRCMEFLLETLPDATTAELESLLPWSETLPDCCRVPVKTDCITED